MEQAINSPQLIVTAVVPTPLEAGVFPLTSCFETPQPQDMDHSHLGGPRELPCTLSEHAEYDGVELLSPCCNHVPHCHHSPFRLESVESIFNHEVSMMVHCLLIVQVILLIFIMMGDFHFSAVFNRRVLC